MKAYYDARAREYDEWYLGQGRFAGLERPAWAEDVYALERAVSGLAPARTLDVACGTGYLTRHLRGSVTALDQSARMLSVATQRLPEATLLRGDAFELPFADGAFDRLFTAHFYGHLEEPSRLQFLAEARRVALELVVVDSAAHVDYHGAGWQERVLNDGSRFNVYKRYFEPDELARELDGVILHASRWFVMVSSGRT